MIFKINVFQIVWLLAIQCFIPTLVAGQDLKTLLQYIFKDQPEETKPFEATRNKVDVLPLNKGLDTFGKHPLNKGLDTFGKHPPNKGLDKFGKNIFSELERNNHEKNIFFSPLSIETCLAMARMGAEGQTAVELDRVLSLSVQNTKELAQNYHTLLAPYQNSSNLKIVNKIYTMRGYKVQNKFKVFLEKYFFSSIGAVNFANSNKAASTINNWVEHKTNNLIKDLVAPGSLDSDTRVVLVNAIHFKAAWKNPFPEELTREMDFYLDESNSVKAQMMFNQVKVQLKYIMNLNATVVELPYKDSDFSMVIVLPNSHTGLPELEENLNSYTLADLTTGMKETVVNILLPKFKTEFEVELSSSLKNLGLERMFSSKAEFGKIFRPSSNLYVSKVVHKAFIEVNEKGTEAAAATGMTLMARSGDNFYANKPFLYFIKDSRNIIFRGNFKKL